MARFSVGKDRLLSPFDDRRGCTDASGSEASFRRVASRAPSALSYLQPRTLRRRSAAEEPNLTPHRHDYSTEELMPHTKHRVSAAQRERPTRPQDVGIPTVDEIPPAKWTEAILKTLDDAGDTPLTLRDIQQSVGRLVPSVGAAPVAHEVELLLRNDFVYREPTRAAVCLTPEGHKLARIYARAAALSESAA